MLTEDEDGSLLPKSEYYSFFDGLQSLIKLSQTPIFISKLVIVCQPVSSLNGVETMINLKELWVAECSIQKIECLEACKDLEKLYLYSNKISQIQGLEKLMNLKTLWLSGNKISEIMNISHLSELTELHLGDNYITRIGKSLIMNKKLKQLNLSGNPLLSLNDTVHLKYIESLSFADPVFKACPLTHLCNYRTFTIYQIKTLKALDSSPVSEEDRINAVATIRKKIIFYRMIKNHTDYCYFNEKYRYEDDKHVSMNRFKDLMYHLKIEELKADKTTASGENITSIPINRKQDYIEIQVKTWNLREKQRNITRSEKHKIEVLKVNLELQSAGNIKFKKINPETYESSGFRKLIDAFSCKDIFGALGISSIKINEVTQIFNKAFQCMQSYIRNTFGKSKSFNYKILCNEYMPDDVYKWPMSIVEHGFFNSKETTYDVTNCIGISDCNWLEEIKKKYDLFSGHQKLYENEKRTMVIVKCQSENLYMKCAESGYLRHRKNQCSNCCKAFTVKNATFLTPVFIIEYEYIYQDSISSKIQEIQHTNEILPGKRHQRQESATKILNSNSLSQVIQENLWIGITKLSLPGCGITTIDKLSDLPNVNSIDLSFNKLTSLCGLESFPNVADLEASFNNICTLADLPVVKNLQTLDITWNNLGRFMPVLRSLKRNAVNLKQLEMDFNPIRDIINFDHMVIFTRDNLPSLQQLNGQSTAIKLRIIKTVTEIGHIKNLDSLNLKYDDIGPTTYWKCEQLCQIFDSTENATIICNNQIVCVMWLNESILSVECPKELEKVKWANFNNNFISDIRFLEPYTLLEELSLSNNLLQSINVTLCRLKYLTKLDLSNNYITSLSFLSKYLLPSLKILNISLNQLTNLYGIEGCPSLSELYAYYNHCETYEDLNSLKFCKNILILDLSSNKIAKDIHFTKYILFHIPSVEIINGEGVNKKDMHEAHLIFGGCLDQDYLIRQNKMTETYKITDLALSKCSFKTINLNSTILPNLVNLDLSYNSLTSFWGIHDLPKLETLCLSHNNVVQLSEECIINNYKYGLPQEVTECQGKEIFPNLGILHLDSNNVQTLATLQLEHIPKLHTLFLQNNKLHSIKGINPAKYITHLILDGNKIKEICSTDINNLSNIQELYLENNRISNLSFLKNFTKLRRLFLGLNKIHETGQLKFISYIIHLEEITLFGNPIIRNPNAYPIIVQESPSLKSIDGCTVNQESNI